MEFLFAAIRTRSGEAGQPGAALFAKYLARAGKYTGCSSREFPSESALLAHLDRSARRTVPYLLLTDSRGKQVSSEEFAAALGRVRDSGVQQLVCAVGPADGWSAEALKRADLTIAFGRITLPHELAAVVLAEQVYRALTILAGHPYHTGH